MALNYIVSGHKFSLSYKALREDYKRFGEMSDEEFLANLIPALHFACVVCFLKEVETEIALSDEGVIHQLVHLLDAEARADLLPRLSEIRAAFNVTCLLA